MPLRTVDIPEELDAFITATVKAGHYANPDAVVKAALELLTHDEEDAAYKRFELRQAIQEGIDSGVAEGSTEDVFARVLERAGLPVRSRV